MPQGAGTRAPGMGVRLLHVPLGRAPRRRPGPLSRRLQCAVAFDSAAQRCTAASAHRGLVMGLEDTEIITSLSAKGGTTNR